MSPKLNYDLDEIQSFLVVPGRYRARLVKCEQTLSKKKNPMLTWYWKIVSGTEKGKDVRSFTSLLDNALGNLKMHLEAFGYKGRVRMDTAKLVGRYAVIVVGTRMGEDNSGVQREQSTITAVLPDKKPGRDADEDEGEAEYEDEDEEQEDEETEDEVEEESDEDESETEDEVEEDEDEDEEEEEPAPRRRPAHSARPVARSSKPASVRSPKFAEDQTRRGVKKAAKHGGKLPF